MTCDIAWLAGILEGEGCFSTHRNCPEVRLGMTDEDIVRRAAAVIPGANPIRTVEPDPRFNSNKTKYTVGWYGPPALEVMRAVLPFMGERRSEKIAEVVEAYVKHGTKECAWCEKAFWAPGKRVGTVCSNECLNARRRAASAAAKIDSGA